jgi:hypothetical protein
MDRQESIQRFEQYLNRRFPDRRSAIDYVSDIRQFAAACLKPWDVAGRFKGRGGG